MSLKSTGVKFFAKIMGGNYVFCFSNKINKDADLKLPTVLRNRVRHMCFL